MHSHYVRAMYGSIFASSWRMTPESVCMHTGAIIFNGAWVTLMPTFFSGATYVLHAAFDATEVIRAIAREKVTHIMLVPTQIISLLNHPEFTEENVSSLEMVLSLGAPLHLEHKQRLNALLPHRFYELYGLTEGFVTVLDKYDYEAKPSSVGVPPPFFDMRIVGEDGRDAPPGIVGEIVGTRTHSDAWLLQSARISPPETIVDGWLYSGDLGYVDEDGFLFLVDRKKDLIISGGVNVYPRDIEEVLVQHPDVEEVAVFGIPDPKWGETPVAAHSPSPGLQRRPGGPQILDQPARRGAVPAREPRGRSRRFSAQRGRKDPQAGAARPVRLTGSVGAGPGRWIGPSLGLPGHRDRKRRALRHIGAPSSGISSAGPSIQRSQFSTNSITHVSILAHRMLNGLQTGRASRTSAVESAAVKRSRSSCERGDFRLPSSPRRISFCLRPTHGTWTHQSHMGQRRRWQLERSNSSIRRAALGSFLRMTDQRTCSSISRRSSGPVSVT